MKTFLAISALAFTSASVFALNSTNRVSRELSRPFYMQRNASVVEKNTQPIQLQGMKTITAMPEAVSGPSAKPQTTYGAYYGFGEGTYHCSLSWDGGWYGYKYALALGYPYASKFNAIIGNNWSMETESGPIDLNDMADDNGDLVLSDFGIGEYYMPTIQNRLKRYLYGSTMEGQILIQSDIQDIMPFAMFDTNEIDGIYGGVNTGTSSGYAYGSSTPYGNSGYTEVRFGKVAGALQVESLNMWLMTNNPDGMMFASDEDFILVTLYDITDQDTLIYTGKVTADNIEEADNGSMCAVVTFADIDEDGFETEVYPVLTGEVTVTIENTEGCDYGIIMASADIEDTDANGRSVYPTSTFWYNDGTGEIEEGMYRWQGADGVVLLNGIYNAMVTNGEGTKECNAFVFDNAQYYTAEDGTQYTWAVSKVSGDTLYNDFSIESTYDADSWEVEYDENVVLGFDIDNDYFEKYNVVVVYVAVAALPEGVTSRTSDIVFTSNESATYTIHLLQGEGGSSLTTVKTDNESKRVYNLQGILVDSKKLAPGFYINNGQKMVVK